MISSFQSLGLNYLLKFIAFNPNIKRIDDSFNMDIRMVNWHLI